MTKTTNIKSTNLPITNSIKIVNLTDVPKNYQKRKSFSTFKALKTDSYPSGFEYDRDLTEGEKEYERKMGELQEVEQYLTVRQYVTAVYVIKDEAELSGDVEDVETYDNDVDYAHNDDSNPRQIALEEVREMSHEQRMHIIESNPDLNKIWGMESTSDSAADPDKQEQNSTSSSDTASEKEPTNTLTTSSATEPSSNTSNTSNTTPTTNPSWSQCALDYDIMFNLNVDLLILHLHNLILFFSILVLVGYIIYFYKAQFLTDKKIAIHLFIFSTIYKLLIYLL